jgi:EmrB/QacA subfamily drug resistance transporter
MPLPRRRLFAALLVVCLGTLTASLDSAVNIAFPSITSAFGLEQADIRWVIISYVLTYASLSLAFGKLGDLLGYRRVFVTGLFFSTLGFAACAVAPSFTALLIGRILQGVGAALSWSCAPALATSLYPERERTRVLGFYSAAIAIGTALGPLAGGVLVQSYGWRVVFWGRLPFVVASLCLAWLIPATLRVATQRRYDWIGALLLIAWLGAFLLAAARPEMEHVAAATGALLLSGLACFAAFLVHESRHDDPIIRPSLLQNPSFLVLNFASIGVNLAGFAVMLLVPFHLASSSGLAPALGGLVLGCNAMGIIVGSLAAGKFAARFGQTPVAYLGTAISVVGLSLVATWTAHTGPVHMAVCLALQGFGLGLFQVAYSDKVLATLPQSDRGVAGSLTLVTRTLGVIGAASGLTALNHALTASAAGGGRTDAALIGFQQTIALVAAGLGFGICLVGAMAAIKLRRKPV